MYCMGVRKGEWGGDIPFPFYSLPPKSGLNRMSYPFISLSTVSFTRGILLGSLISLTLGEGRERKKYGGVMQKSLLISHASHAFSFFFFLSAATMTRGDTKRAYLWVHTQVTSKEKVKIPKWFFLILPIATVFEVVSRCE